MKYRIRWRVKSSGVEDVGSLRDDRQTLDEWVKQLNKEYPDIEHWVEVVH